MLLTMVKAYWGFNHLYQQYLMVQKKRVFAGQKTGPSVLLPDLSGAVAALGTGEEGS